MLEAGTVIVVIVIEKGSMLQCIYRRMYMHAEQVDQHFPNQLTVLETATCPSYYVPIDALQSHFSMAMAAMTVPVSIGLGTK